MTKWAGMFWFRFVSSMDFEPICMHVLSNEGFVAMGAAADWSPRRGIQHDIKMGLSK